MAEQDKNKSLAWATRRIFLETGRGPTDEELVALLKTDLDEVRKLKDSGKWKYRDSDLSFDELLGLAEASLKKNPRLLAKLTPCERDVISLAIGSEEKTPCSCEEISEILQLRLNLVRWVRCRAIVKLTHWS